jgi:hypothetical protein
VDEFCQGTPVALRLVQIVSAYADLIALREARDDSIVSAHSVTRDRSFPVCQMTSGQPVSLEKGDFPMATYDTIRGQILARVPGIDPADIPGLLQMLVYTVRGPEKRDMTQVRHMLAGLEMLWVEEIADLQEVIAAQQLDGLARGLTESAAEAEVMTSLWQEFMRRETPYGSWRSVFIDNNSN